MHKRVSPTEAIHAEIDAVFAEGRPLADCLEQVAQLGAKLIIQTALEAEVDEFLGRARYRRADAAQAQADGEGDGGQDVDAVEDAEGAPTVRAGHRNGHREVTIKTTSGPVKVKKPKLRGTSEKFASRLFGTRVTRTNALESLVIASFVRGLSTRDVTNTLAEALGSDAALSKSTVSSICHAIRTEYDAWRERDLSGVALDYLFIDASHFRMHPNAPAEPVLAAWGIDTDGKPVFIGLEAAGSESHDAWADFLTGLLERGLMPPLLVISDGGAGLISACEQILGRGLRQRCLIHKCRNVTSKVSRHDLGQVKKEFLGDLRHQRARPAARPPARRDRSAPHRRLRGEVGEDLPRSRQVPSDRPEFTDRLPALPRRAPQVDPALQLHRADLRRDPPRRQGHRPLPRRDLLRQSGLRCPVPRCDRMAGLHHHPDRPAPTRTHATRPAPPRTCRGDPPRTPGPRVPHQGRVTSTPRNPSSSFYTAPRTRPKKLVGDITYIKTGEGWLHLATVIDCCTKEVIGYAMDDHYQTPLISRPIRNAARNRKLTKDAIFHSDRGSNYMSAEIAVTLKQLGLRRSSGRTGICFDNAMAESFFGALKNERVSRVAYLTREAARQDVTRYIEFWHNRKRLHSAVGYRPPQEVHAEYMELRIKVVP